MTKYILHGGNAQKPCIDNDRFLSGILKDFTNNPKILLVHFAGKPEKAEINKERDISQFERVKEDNVVAGESAGANVLSTVCYSKSSGGAFECLGFLPIKTIPHYLEGLDEELEALHVDLERSLSSRIYVYSL